MTAPQRSHRLQRPVACAALLLLLGSTATAAAQTAQASEALDDREQWEAAEAGEASPEAPAEATNGDQVPADPKPPAPPARPPAANTDSSALREEITEARLLAEALQLRVWKLEQSNALTATERRAHDDALNAFITLLKSFDERAKALAKKSSSGAESQRRALSREVRQVTEGLAAIGTQLESLETASGWSLVDKLLSARCSTAICFDNGADRHWLGIEPLVELPIGIGFAVGNSSLADYVNNHDLRIDLAAGVRVWLFRDVISVSVYLSKPLLDTSIRAEGSRFVYPSTSVRRPFPGFAIGLLFDSIWLGFDRNELRNGDGKDSSALNPAFAPNQVVSSAWTITLALQPVTAFRTAIGTANQANQEASQ